MGAVCPPFLRAHFRLSFLRIYSVIICIQLYGIVLHSMHNTYYAYTLTYIYSIMHRGLVHTCTVTCIQMYAYTRVYTVCIV